MPDNLAPGGQGGQEVIDLPFGFPGGSPGGFPLGGTGIPSSGGVSTSGSRGPSTATLGGVVLLNSKPIRWSTREGVTPVIETFHIMPGDKLGLSKERAVTLELKGPRGGISFRQLWIIDFPPGPNPNIAAVTVADRRYWWQYSHVLRRYNMRRRVGVKRPPNPTAELQPLLPDIQYARYSLKNPEGSPPEAKWKARDVLEDLLKKAAKGEKGIDAGFNLGPIAGESGVSSIPIENLEIDDSADQALARALAHLPGWSLYVDPNGQVKIYNRADGEDRGVVESLRPEIVGMGHATLVQNQLKRPVEIHVLFTPEVEVRFDFKEQSGQTQTTRTEKQKEDQRLLDNVLPIPDFSLDVQGNTLAQGTWITVDDALANWPVNPARTRRLVHADLLRLFVPFKDLWTPFVTAMASGAPQQDWAARTAALQTHWRRTFRLPQRWMDRTLSVRAYRVATVDPVTGSRAPANAYMDFVMLVGARAFFGLGQSDRARAPYAINVQQFPGGAAIGSTTKASPVDVRVIDHDQGIIQLDLLPDPGRMFTRLIPGSISQGVMPTGDIALAGRSGTPVAFNGAPSGNWVKLDTNWKMAVIITLVPAAPNSEAQLYRVVVKPDDVKDLLPPFARGNLKADGPIMQIRIPASVETARVRWDDDDAVTIAKIFGVGLGENEEPPDYSRLVVNKVTGTRTVETGQTTTEHAAPGAAGLENIARAEAARIWAGYGDRFEGQVGGDMGNLQGGRIGLAGNLEELVFEIAPDGRATVQATLPTSPPHLGSLYNFLDPGTRALVMHLVKGDE